MYMLHFHTPIPWLPLFVSISQETDGSCKYNTDSDAEEVWLAVVPLMHVCRRVAVCNFSKYWLSFYVCEGGGY